MKMTGSTAFIAEIQALKEQNRVLRDALDDIYRHSILPFTGLKWTNYVHEVAFQALKPTLSTVPAREGKNEKL